MPRVPRSKALTTRDTIAALWAQAEAEGSLLIYPKSQKEAYLIRNKLYAHLSRERKAAYAHTGINACHLDSFRITFGPLARAPEPSLSELHPDSWFLSISRCDPVEFQISTPLEPEPHSPFDDLVFETSKSSKQTP